MVYQSEETVMSCLKHYFLILLLAFTPLGARGSSVGLSGKSLNLKQIFTGSIVSGNSYCTKDLYETVKDQLSQEAKTDLEKWMKETSCEPIHIVIRNNKVFIQSKNESIVLEFFFEPDHFVLVNGVNYKLNDPFSEKLHKQFGKKTALFWTFILPQSHAQVATYLAAGGIALLIIWLVHQYFSKVNEKPEKENLKSSPAKACRYVDGELIGDCGKAGTPPTEATQ